MLMSTKNSRHY